LVDCTFNEEGNVTAITHGYCTVCSSLQTVTEHPALGFIVGYHLAKSGEVCEGFSQPTKSLIQPQGGSKGYEDLDHDRFEITREGDLIRVGVEEDWPDDPVAT
jgi:hypothetical protein